MLSREVPLNEIRPSAKNLTSASMQFFTLIVIRSRSLRCAHASSGKSDICGSRSRQHLAAAGRSCSPPTPALRPPTQRGLYLIHVPDLSQPALTPRLFSDTLKPAGSGEALLRYVLFFWIMYKIYIFMQCALILRSKIHILFSRAYA